MFVSQRPVPALADVVALLWATRCDATHVERVLPTSRPQLLIRRSVDRLSWLTDRRHDVSGAALAGPFARAISIDASQQDDVVGIVFHPGGLRAFGVSVEAVAGHYADLREVWPALLPAVERSREVALEASLWVLQRALLVQRKSATDPAVEQAARALSAPRARVHSVADALGWSRRTLSRRFASSVGLGPKAFARLHRFRRAAETLSRAADLADHALSHGFVDQSHLTHDFRDLAGMTPHAWQLATRPYASHAVVGL